MTAFPATRTAALERLAAFLPDAGRAYAARRNHDLPGHPHVSRLSPWLRHRLITEEEVAEATLRRHSPQAADKFLAELLWRTYWKGWLELRPAVWADYRRGLDAALDRLATEAGLRTGWAAACRGETGIDGFDHWARELTQTGYLHNHARMWFASIWIFTLRLPWELGADFFLRHLLDGDPASNTLSWRWVAGIQTPGKTYLARPANIAEYTGGRFRPMGLAPEAPPLPMRPHPAPRPAPVGDAPDPGAPFALILTEEDLSPGFLLRGPAPVATALWRDTAGRSPLAVAPGVDAWVAAAMEDAAARWQGRLGTVWRAPPGTGGIPALADWARGLGVAQVVTPHAPVGPVAAGLDRLAAALAPDGIRLVRALRDWDRAAWPHATHGFFRFREQIPRLLAHLAA
jgi:deoxyribodipyrimidine photo-lyase